MNRNLIKSWMLGISFSALSLIGVMSSCTDKVDDSNLYTFTGETMADYIATQANLSDFNIIVKKVKLSKRSQSTLGELLSTRGHFTAFIPTNQAIQVFLDSIYTTSGYDINSIPDSTAEYIAKSCIIDNGDDDAYLSTNFEATGALEKTNMNNRFITIDFDTINSSIIVNAKSRITVKDVEVENGVAYQVDRVLAPSTATLPSLLSQTDNTRIFAHLVEMTGWDKQMSNYTCYNFDGYDTYEDYVAEHPKGAGCPTENGGAPVDNPPHRNYGYTAFVEPDELYENQWGIKLNINNGLVQNWDEVMATIKTKCAELYPNADPNADIKSENNPINQFISYHLIATSIPFNKLVIHYNEMGVAYTKPEALTIDTWEYYETMGSQRRLLKITEGSQTGGKRINRHATYDMSNYSEASVDRQGLLISGSNGKSENNALNGFYYLIDNFLVYDNDVPTKVLNERMRFDFTSLMPELITNGMRRISVYKNYHFPPGYFRNWTFSTETEPNYLSGYGASWVNYQGDEFNVFGQYDMTLKLPPVPYEGTYELRYGFSINDQRGMCQIYIGTDPNNLPAYGLPIDLRLLSTNASVGWVADGTDVDENDANDKVLRTHGYMKAPQSFGYDSKTGVTKAYRTVSNCVRKILWTGTMSPNKTYYMRMKSVLESTKTQLFADYIELVPKSVYNGIVAEDKW